MYDYAIVNAINNLISRVDLLSDYLHSVLTPILYIILFAFLLKIGFHCIRGYKA